MVMESTTSFVQLMMLVVTPSHSQKRVSFECETRTDSQGTPCGENILVISKEAVGNSWDILYAILGDNIIQIIQTASYLMNEAKICNKYEFYYSL